MKSRVILYVFFCLALLLFMSTCGLKNDNGSTPIASTPTETFIYPSDDELNSIVILPTDIGTEWTYAIHIGDVDPVRYREIYWEALDGTTISYRKIEFFPELAKSSDRSRTYYLTMQVSGQPKDQGLGFHWDHAAELTIVRDDLGIYDGAKQIFWLVPPGDYTKLVVGAGTEVSEMVIYPKEMAPGGIAKQDGLSLRFILNCRMPGTCESSYGGDNTESLASLLPVNNFPYYENKWVFPYERKVGPYIDTTGSGASFPNGFVEKVWYADHVGMVRLEQWLDNQLSMTWVLESYSLPNK